MISLAYPLVYHAEFRTTKYEAHIDKKEPKKWIVTIYNIENAVKELFKQEVMESFHEAYRYIEKNILFKNNKNNEKG